MNRAAILIVAMVLPLCGQTSPEIVTGEKAAQLFVYQGKPVHPFCVDFPIDSSRNDPVELSKCTKPAVPPKSDREEWWTAEETGEYPRYISYRVLAKKGNRFLIASQFSGGGSGQFSSLDWVRLKRDRVQTDDEVTGGDRCSGGLSGYSIQGTIVRYTQARSTVGILFSSGQKIDDSRQRELHWQPAYCDGQAAYRYDLKTERSTLESLTLSEPDESADESAPQQCFDRLVRARVKAGRAKLTPGELKDFGRRFASECATPGVK